MPAEKKCGRCGVVKDAAAFGVNRSRYDGLQCHCRDCKSTIQSQWYEKNKERHIAVSTDWNRRRVRNLREKIAQYLRQHPCVDCGESELLMLDFDHARGEKYKVSSQMVSDCRSWEVLQVEIAKCEVRCVRCHRRKTAEQLGWFYLAT